MRKAERTWRVVERDVKRASRTLATRESEHVELVDAQVEAR